MSLLEVKNLRIEYPSRYGVLAAVKDLSFSVEKGEIVGVVGESGAGKSTIGNAVIDLLSPPGRIARGDIYLNGELISGKSQNEMRAIRGSRIGFIFQDPMTSLNPLFTVEQQLVETILANTDLNREAAFAKALELMGAVGIPQPEVRIKQYPHQFSGGMRQRVVIAIALSGDPELIIADEPTTALDVWHHRTGAGSPQPPLYPQPHLGGTPLGCKAGAFPPGLLHRGCRCAGSQYRSQDPLARPESGRAQL